MLLSVQVTILPGSHPLERSHKAQCFDYIVKFDPVQFPPPPQAMVVRGAGGVVVGCLGCGCTQRVVVSELLVSPSNLLILLLTSPHGPCSQAAISVAPLCHIPFSAVFAKD